jgi:hypothetical protein
MIEKEMNPNFEKFIHAMPHYFVRVFFFFFFFVKYFVSLAFLHIFFILFNVVMLLHHIHKFNCSDAMKKNRNDPNAKQFQNII